MKIRLKLGLYSPTGAWCQAVRVIRYADAAVACSPPFASHYPLQETQLPSNQSRATATEYFFQFGVIGRSGGQIYDFPVMAAAKVRRLFAYGLFRRRGVERVAEWPRTHRGTCERAACALSVTRRN